jgi:hypothetical protein
VKRNINSISGLKLLFSGLSFLLLWLCSSFHPVDSKNLINKKWPPALVDKIWQQSDIPYFKSEEKNTLFYINLVRVNPKLFYDTFVYHFRDSLIVKNPTFLVSLKTDLYKTPPMAPLQADITLFEVAKNHAIQMGQTGKVGHTSIYGDSYQTRMDALTRKHKKLLEACQYGYSRGLYVVIDLLIDDGVANLGHRKALLNEQAKYVGVSMQSHRKYGTNTVIELAYERK